VQQLEKFLELTMLVFEANDFPVQALNCSEEPYVQTRRSDKLLSDLSKEIEESSLIYVDDDLKVWQNLAFDVKTSSGETTATIDRFGVKTVANNQIVPAKRFFRVGIVQSIPYTYLKRDPKTNEVILDANKQPIYEGYCIDFISELSRRMNFSFELVEPKRGNFGKKLDDGNFDGAVGDLIKGETDLIVAALKMTAQREEFIDFVAPYFEQTGIMIIMRKPTADTSLFKFMTVLRLEVWLSILGALSITAVVIWILEVFSPYSARNWNYGENLRWARRQSKLGTSGKSINVWVIFDRSGDLLCGKASGLL
jgi:glutamate receptor, ionotropic, invertebrate